MLTGFRVVTRTMRRLLATTLHMPLCDLVQAKAWGRCCTPAAIMVAMVIFLVFTREQELFGKPRYCRCQAGPYHRGNGDSLQQIEVEKVQRKNRSQLRQPLLRLTKTAPYTERPIGSEVVDTRAGSRAAVLTDVNINNAAHPGQFCSSAARLDIAAAVVLGQAAGGQGSQQWLQSAGLLWENRQEHQGFGRRWPEVYW